MTITSTVNKVVYDGDGATSVFPVNFPFFEDTELEVSLLNEATQVITPLVLDTNYTVSIDVPGLLPSVGDVTLIGGNSPLAVGFELIIRRVLPVTQLADFKDNESTPAAAFEEAFDRAIMVIQQLKEEIERTIQQSVTSDSPLEIPTPITGYFLQALSTTLLGWVSAITTVQYAGTITRGLDAGKSGSPGLGDIYIATDTGRMYVANSIGVWSQIAFTANGLGLDVAQAAHGLAVNDVVKFSGGLYSKAKADTEANSRVVGIVSSVAGVDDFTISIMGLVQGLSGLVAGSQYYLSPTTAGLLTTTKPSTAGQIIKQVMVAISATSGFIIIGSGEEVAAAITFAMPKNYLTGLKISNNAVDATNDLDFAAGSCRDDADADDIVVGAFTKRIDATFVAGNNGGMLDGGAIGAVADLIYFFAIDDSTAINAGDILASKSRTAPTMPAGYDLKRLIGHRRWTGAAWGKFVSVGTGNDRWTYLFTNLQVLTNGSATVFTDVNCSAVVDGNIAGIIDVGARISKSGTSSIALHIRPNGSTQAIGQDNKFNEAQDDQGGPGNPSGVDVGLIPVDTTAIFEYANSAGGADADIYLRGYLENL